MRIGLVIVIIILVGFGIRLYSITRGLAEGREVVINEIDLSRVDDGFYTGSYDVGRWANEVMVEVSGYRIIDIKITKPVTYEDVEQTQELIEKVLEKQNTSVDAVSGATVTSKAYLKSIENALTH